MPSKISVLIIGDIVGKIGRRVVKAVLPQWQKKYNPDLTIANIENLAHGKGITEKTLTEMNIIVINGMNGLAGAIFWSTTGSLKERSLNLQM